MRKISVEYLIDEDTEKRLARAYKAYKTKIKTDERFTEDKFFALLMTMSDKKKISDALELVEMMLAPDDQSED